MSSSSSDVWKQRRAELSKSRYHGLDDYLPEGITSIEQARLLHGYRSERAQKQDELLEAQITTDIEKWKSAPNKFDIVGVDQFPVPLKKDDFVTNTKILAYAAEEYYKTDFSGVKIVATTDEETYDKEYGEKDTSKSAIAFADHKKNSIVFSPKITRLIAKGSISDKYEAFSVASVVHELGHLAGRTSTGSAFDEGVNEILAERFMINHVQMPRQVRAEFLQEPIHSYRRETNIVANTALLVSGGDKVKAIKWLEELRTHSRSTVEHERSSEIRDKATRLLSKRYGIQMGMLTEKSKEGRKIKYIDTDLIWWLHASTYQKDTAGLDKIKKYLEQKVKENYPDLSFEAVHSKWWISA